MQSMWGCFSGFMNIFLAILELGQMRSAHIYCFLLYSSSLKVSCEGYALIFCISLKLGDKNKVDSTISDKRRRLKDFCFFWQFGFIYCSLEITWKCSSCWSVVCVLMLRQGNQWDQGRCRCQCCTAEQCQSQETWTRGKIFTFRTPRAIF